MQEKPTIFVSNFHPFISRNIFDSSALAKIAEGANEVIVFVLKHKEKYLKEKYETGNIKIIGLDLHEAIKTRREVLGSRIAEILLDTHTKKLHQKIYLEHDKKYLKYFLSRAVMATLAHSVLFKRFFRAMILRFNNVDVFGEYFKQYKPEITVSTDPFSPYDIIFMKNARQTNTKLIGLIRSWDNFTTKEYLQVKPDSVIVQNEEMITEGKTLHDLDTFTIVGVPQFEYYLRYTPIDRESFCKRMHLDPKKRIVLFSPAGDKFTSTDWQICEILKQQQAEGKLPNDLQFLVRLHPMNGTDLSKFEPTENFVIDDPNSSYESGHAKESEMGVEHVNHLADSLHHSVLVLNSVSSLLIDAAILDKPVVTICFDGWEKNVPLTRSILTEQSNEWLQVLLNKGLSPKANNPEEMAVLMNQYLNDPTKDKDKRATFVQEHCFKLDGKAPERMAAAIL